MWELGIGCSSLERSTLIAAFLELSVVHCLFAFLPYCLATSQLPVELVLVPSHQTGAAAEALPIIELGNSGIDIEGINADL